MSGRALLVIVWSVLVSTPSVRASELFSQHFGSEPLNERLLQLVGPQASKAAEKTGKGLLIKLPVQSKGHGQVGVGTRFGVAGDFEITLAYYLTEVAEPDKGYGAGIMLALVTADELPVTVNLAHRRQMKGKAAFGTNIWTSVDKKMKSDSKSFAVDATVAHGKLRVVRTGSTVRFLVAEGDSNDFRELRQSELGTQPLKSVQVMGDTGGSTKPVKVHLTELSIQADALPFGLPPTQERSIWTGWVILGFVGAMVLVASGVWYWRR